MRFRIRAVPLLFAAAALVVFAACGGDDSKAEKKTRDAEATTAAAGSLGQAGANTGSPSTSGASSSGALAQATVAPANATRALQVDCGKDLTAFRFNGKLNLQTPGSSNPNSADPSALITGLLNDVKFSGAYVTPDRTQFKLEGGQNSLLGSQGVEFIQIGNTSYTKLGGAGWQSAAGDSPFAIADNFDPRALCKQIQDNLKGDVPSRKEKVNGIDATRYDYDRKTLEKLDQGGFLGGIGQNGQLPDNFKMNVWISDKEKFPVKIQLSGSGQQSGEKYAVDLELNVIDLNGNVKIDAPK